MKEIINQYGKTFGQVVNFDKSAIYFNKSTIDQTRQETSKALDKIREATNVAYLGLSMASGRQKKQVFRYIKSKIISKMQGWKKRLQSQDGKRVPIKSVIMAMPTYAMVCCRLPKGLCRDIASKIAQFCWGNGEKENNTHCASQKKLTEVKGMGGIGFRELEAFNTALLAKQIW